MTNHPAKGMSKPQIRTFEDLCVGGQPAFLSKRTIAALADCDLIIPGQNGRPVQVRDWAHIQWCAWCSEQPEESAA